jgi:hypothetical protein
LTLVSSAHRLSIAYRPAAMAGRSANGSGKSVSKVLTATSGRRAALALGVAIAGVSAVAVGWIAILLILRWVRMAGKSARFAFRFATLGAFRRCPDCKRLLRSDAKVCSRCGYRRPVKRSRRARKVERQAAAVV